VTLATRGKTIAVLGSGINKIYPAVNKPLVEEIVKNKGLILSEHPPNTGPQRYFFPLRNRIIVGLSRGLFIAQAGRGAMITAKLGIEENRDIFTIPGSILSDNYRGNNWLLKQGAFIVTEPDDILNQFGLIEAKTNS
jgi:DNA processing protein